MEIPTYPNEEEAAERQALLRSNMDMIIASVKRRDPDAHESEIAYYVERLLVEYDRLKPMGNAAWRKNTFSG